VWQKCAGGLSDDANYFVHPSALENKSDAFEKKGEKYKLKPKGGLALLERNVDYWEKEELLEHLAETLGGRQGSNLKNAATSAGVRQGAGGAKKATVAKEKEPAVKEGGRRSRQAVEETADEEGPENPTKPQKRRR
jgi:hypothetical protein